MPFIVETYTLCDGWINCWTVEAEGISSPQFFDSEAEAQKEIDADVQELRDVYEADGEEFDEVDEREQYRIRRISKQELFK